MRGADTVTTVTPDKINATILTHPMIEPGMHVNAVGSDCPGKTELQPGVLEAAAVFVECEPQARIEGDIQQMPTGFAMTEFRPVLPGMDPGRGDATRVTVFDSVDLALEVHAAPTFMSDATAEPDIGDIVELVPQSNDPKALFSALRDAMAPVARPAAPARPLRAPA